MFRRPAYWSRPEYVQPLRRLSSRGIRTGSGFSHGFLLRSTEGSECGKVQPGFIVGLGGVAPPPVEVDMIATILLWGWPRETAILMALQMAAAGVTAQHSGWLFWDGLRRLQ